MADGASAQPGAEAAGEELAERVFGALIGSLELACMLVGDRLGLYRALDEAGGLDAPGLAGRTGLDERYLREWLEQQAAAGMLAVDDPAAEPGARRFRVPAGHRAGLLDPDSPLHIAPAARLAVGVLAPFEDLLTAFRTGEGVPYPAFGPDTREGIAGFNRPMFVNQLAQEWIPAIPDLDARLREGPARVADLGCGGGWSSVCLALGYPGVSVEGIDSDPASIAAARELAAARGVADRVTFRLHDAGGPAPAREYDLVTIFEALHDMAHPVEVLAAARAMLVEGGSVLVADERVAERFDAPGDEIERLNYGFSVLHCLAVGREDAHAACTGTVMRPATVDAYARSAGFPGAEVLPIEHDFWRFYRMRA